MLERRITKKRTLDHLTGERTFSTQVHRTKSRDRLSGGEKRDHCWRLLEQRALRQAVPPYMGEERRNPPRPKTNRRARYFSRAGSPLREKKKKSQSRRSSCSGLEKDLPRYKASPVLHERKKTNYCDVFPEEKNPADGFCNQRETSINCVTGGKNSSARITSFLPVEGAICSSEALGKGVKIMNDWNTCLFERFERLASQGKAMSFDDEKRNDL